jgi:hypothetical protein
MAKNNNLFMLASVAVVAIVGIVVMILQGTGSYSFDQNLVGEAFAIKKAQDTTIVLEVDRAVTTPSGLVLRDPSLFVGGATSLLVDELEAGTVIVVEDGVIFAYEVKPADREDIMAAAIGLQHVSVDTIIDAADLDDGTYLYKGEGIIIIGCCPG